MINQIDLFAICKGDASVGLDDLYWTVENVVVDLYDEHREDVRKAFSEAFATLVGEKVSVTFSDEWQD